MESALAATRLIEYPSDLSGCSSVDMGGRQLLYLCSRGNNKSFVVVLGFFSGQKEDVVTKDLIEPVTEESKPFVGEMIASALPEEHMGAHIFFL